MASLNEEIPIISGEWNNYSYRVKSINNNVVLLNIWSLQNQDWWGTPHAFQFDSSNGTWSDVNSEQVPNAYSTTLTGTRSTTVSGYPTKLFGWKDIDSTSHKWEINTPSWAQPPSGPTVTAITVAQENDSTREFTVTHTGTLNASDITYFIDGTDITTLTSPNTPIFDLLTTATGSTFKSYTVNKIGFHSIHIDNKKLQFYVTGILLDNNPNRLADNNITVTWPTTDAEWLSHFSYSAKLFTTTNYVYLNSQSNPTGYSVTSGETLAINTTYKNPQNNVWGFHVILYQYNLLNNTATSSEFYWDPVVNLTQTWNPSPASQYIYGNNFTFDFATQSQTPVAPVRRGGNGYPDRYPLIMTNLFNRQRSIYAIGMTHKDTYDLFL